MSPLALLNAGETAEIVAHHSKLGHAKSHGHGHYHQHGSCVICQCPDKGLGNPPVGHNDHLQNMGLRPGKQVEMITNSGTGPLVLRVDECRIAMGRGAAMKIYVRRIEQ